MKSLGLKNLRMRALITLFVLIGSSCATLKAPDVPVCSETSVTSGRCTWTLSGKTMIIDDKNKYEGKSWWEWKPYMLQLFPSSYAPIKATMAKVCHVYQKDCAEYDVNKTLKTIDQMIEEKAN